MSNFLLKHSRSSTIWMKPIKLFFPFNFLLHFFLVVVLCQITNLFQDPKDTFFSLNLPTTQSKMWILSSFMPFLHQHMVYDTIPHPFKYRRDSSVFSHPYSLLLITTPSTFAWYPRDWYACFSVPEPARLPLPWEEKPQLVHFAISWINNDYMSQVCDRIFLSELRGVFHFSVLLKSSQTYLLHLSFPHWTIFFKKLINWFMIREVSELMTYSHNSNLHLERDCFMALLWSSDSFIRWTEIPFCSADRWWHCAQRICLYCISHELSGPLCPQGIQTPSSVDLYLFLLKNSLQRSSSYNLVDLG